MLGPRDERRRLLAALIARRLVAPANAPRTDTPPAHDLPTYNTTGRRAGAGAAGATGLGDGEFARQGPPSPRPGAPAADAPATALATPPLPQGGQVTNSPPANVNLAAGLAEGEPARVLASGIDSLSLAITLRWRDERAFERLAELKQLAKEHDDGEPIAVTVGPEESRARFEIKPHGGKGYEWLLIGREMTIKLGNWLVPKQRPSAMVDVRSETLWMHGAKAAVERVRAILTAMGADVLETKPSRLDLCVDFLLPEREWLDHLPNHFVTRARKNSTWRTGREVSGFTIGSGALSARIYDKPREIGEQSHKDWMFDTWGIPTVPDGHRIIRVEFQIRRDALRETKINSWNDVRTKLLRAWAYCSKRWLRLAQDPGLHHTQQRLLPWWAIVQDGFRGAQQAEPLVREKSVNADLRRLSAQSVGTLCSIAALGLGDRASTEDATRDKASLLRDALDMFRPL